MKTLKRIAFASLLITALVAACFTGLVVYALASDYKPGDSELIYRSENASVLKDSADLSLLTWNIGYAGLDKDMDFFYDGGTKVRTPREKCLENLSAINDFLKKNDTIDFIFIQEIDRNSKRSYHIDEYAKASEVLKDHKSFFATNYDVFFVPTPPSKPIGKVKSGIAVYSEFTPESSFRFSLPGDFGFPTQLFYLDRCFMVNRYKVENGRELVVINTHNEAFDEGGAIRKAQMERLREFILNEYNAGNYVITGGDWNQYPPDFKPAFTKNKAFTGQIGNFDLVGIEPDFMPSDWLWIFDPSTPSVRTLMAAYDPESTPTSTCDAFLISPNIKSISVNCIQLEFKNSDHNPVIMQVRLEN
jgi:endonuclease/exonuclease/phosphatase family metal-dependent hydrolase